MPDEMRDYLERRIKLLEERLEAFQRFVEAVANSPSDAASSGLRKRARELLGLMPE